MNFSCLSRFMPKWIRSSITLKVLLYVGTSIICLVALQTYININQMDKKLNPLVIQKLKHTLLNSENIFNIIAKQTREDAKIIGSHNALSNYIDYEQLNDPQGMNEEIVNLEQFLRSLTNFKPQYQNIEVFNKNGSIIRFHHGKIVEGSNLYLLLLKDTELKTLTSPPTPFIKPYFSHINEQVLFTLTESFNGGNPFTKDSSSEVFINITNNITHEVLTLQKALHEDRMLLSLTSLNMPILTVNPNELSTERWLTESLDNPNINLHLTVHKEKEEAFLIIRNMETASLILAFGSIIVISISLFITTRSVIGSPLKSITQFINTSVLKDNDLKSRYHTDSEDEIGVFSAGLNNMLDEIQLRENALKRSEERLALALRGGDEGMWEYQYSNNTVYLDVGSTKILGLGKESLKRNAQDFFKMIHPDDLNKFHHYIESFLTSYNEKFEVEFRFITQANKHIWLKLKGKSNEINQEKVGITGTLRDISKEVKAEQQIQLYATAFNSSNNGIAILDPKFYILAVNKAFNRITGVPPKEAIGTLATFIGQHENAIKTEDIHNQIYKHGYWNGEILGKRKNNDVYLRDVDLNPVYSKDKVLTHYVCVFSDITEKKKSEKQLWKMANYDILTKLPNRGFFRKTIKTAINDSIGSNDIMALLFIDLDKFKQVNDTLGHEAGDLVLKKVAAILSKTTRKSDTISRLGGDEFAILLEGIDKKENAEIVAKKIIAEFESGLQIQDTLTDIGVSIGISFYPEDARDAQSLVHCADTAMYSAKTTGSNLFHFYHSTMRDHVNRRNQIEHELSVALKEGGLCLYYQPQLDMTTGKIVSFEALSRWFHPELGFISPDEFIPIAEETGMIAELGLTAFNQACSQLKQWHDQGYKDLRMAINISAKQFMVTDLLSDLSASIKKNRIDAKCIELELTESLIIEDPEKIINMLNALKSLGITLSIDDFGTGYSSLSYLSQFPLDILKIDKSFIQQIESDDRMLTLTKAIVGIAASLDLKVIAEGVETKEQLNILKDFGCHYMQGYYYSPAVSVDKAELLLKSNFYLT